MQISWLNSLLHDPLLSPFPLIWHTPEAELPAWITKEAWQDLQFVGEYEEWSVHITPPMFWYDPEHPERLLVSLGGYEREHAVLIPLEPTGANVAQFFEQYVAPSQLHEPIFPLNFARIREVRAETQPVLTETLVAPEQRRTFRIFLGWTDLDGIVNIENQAVFNPFMYGQALTMATASSGNYSQYQTNYTRSVLTFHFDDFYMEPEEYLIFLQLDYQACAHRTWIKAEQTTSDQRIVQILPDDLPYDVFGALRAYGFNFARIEPEAFAEAIEGNLYSAIELMGLLPDERLERRVLPLLETDSPQIHRLITQEALRRTHKPVLRQLIHSTTIDPELPKRIKELCAEHNITLED